MTCTFRSDFDRDLKKLRNKTVARAVERVIESVERATTLADVPNVTAMQGAKGYYRVRIGDWRIGVRVDGAVVDFLCCGHRREIYRRFP